MSHSSISPAAALGERIARRPARVGVVDLGYVGLPLAVEFAGFQTIGIDLDGRKVDAIGQGTSYITDVATEEVTRLVVDTRNAITGDHPHVLKLGAPARTVRDQLAESDA